jgi:hypothetical protein
MTLGCVEGKPEEDSLPMVIWDTFPFHSKGGSEDLGRPDRNKGVLDTADSNVKYQPIEEDFPLKLHWEWFSSIHTKTYLVRVGRGLVGQCLLSVYSKQVKNRINSPVALLGGVRKESQLGR